MGVRALEGNYDFYELLQDIPSIDVGAIFYWDKNDTVYGSVAEGCLKLCWTPNGNCYKGEGNCGLCGDTIIFHASARTNIKWFKLIQESIKIKENIPEMTIGDIENELGYKFKLVTK
jgi:hypothetical protein